MEQSDQAHSKGRKNLSNMSSGQPIMSAMFDIVEWRGAEKGLPPQSMWLPTKDIKIIDEEYLSMSQSSEIAEEICSWTW